MKKKIIISCKGDHNWEKTFYSKKKAYEFLYNLLEVNDLLEEEFVFDIEDDCIVWKEGRNKKYCAGWHWLDEHYRKKQIIMPDGESLYDLFALRYS